MAKEEKRAKKEFWLWPALDKVLAVASGVLLIGVLFLMTLQIVMRYAFNSPLAWSEEIARYSMVWMAFIGSALAVRKKAHVCVDLIVGAFPAKLQRAVWYLTQGLSLVFLGVVTYYGCLYVRMNLSNYSLISGICRGYVYMIIPVCTGLMFVYTILSIKEG